ncbi:MAG: methyltransferase domain-containing protein [Alistipes sp.]
MDKIITAERVSRDASDNYVFQRSLLAYHVATERIHGEVLEIGTGAGYGIEVIAPHATHFVTIDKRKPTGLKFPPQVEFQKACVPPLPFADHSFDYVISFQVIEHIRYDHDFICEVKRVLRPGGQFIVSTPNRKMSLTRNPWHVREYTADEFQQMLRCEFTEVEALGVFGNEKIMTYYEQNRRGVERITRYDIFQLQRHMPRFLLKIPYDILNRINRHRLLSDNNDLTRSITRDDYYMAPVADNCFDLFYIATK